jgi:hypothetical protein
VAPLENTQTTAATDDTKALWATHARDVLVDVARGYNGVVTAAELSALVQERSGMTTRQLTSHWIGDVLGRVARECRDRSEPNLAALCVYATGSVGSSYPASVKSFGGELDGDADNHAAAERLQCYRHFGATIPMGGGYPTLTPQLQRKRDRASTLKMAAIREPKICPTCNMALPASGICDNCD